MDRLDPEESSRKRLKVSQELDLSSTAALSSQILALGGNLTRSNSAVGEDDQRTKEAEVGITHYVNPHISGFSGILKKRYTDFLVNEIVPSGETLHLRSLEPPPNPSGSKKSQAEDSSAVLENKSEQATEQPSREQPGDGNDKGITQSGKAPSNEAPERETEAQISTEDNNLLRSYLGAETTQKIIELYKQVLVPKKERPGQPAEVKSPPVTDRGLRTSIHQAIRAIFRSRLESSTSNDGAMVISEGSSRPSQGRGQSQSQNRGQKRNAKPSWAELGGDYLHFTIYKENKDTMEVISHIARQAKANPKFFQFAGTKDRRGVTVQRASAYRMHASRLAGMNRSLRNACLGDFEYQEQGLELGDLGGNEFVITLRDCQFPGIDTKDQNCASQASKIVSQSLGCLREKGYFNYYGLQRFGTFSTRTDTVGIKMLQGDLKGACEAILRYGPETLAAAQNSPSTEDKGRQVSSDDKSRAVAINIFQTTNDAREALHTMPRKFSAETNIIRHLGSAPNDYQGALKTIPRNLRRMYVHAYQSLVWNCAIGERWDLFGDKVVEGDLVIVQDHKDKEEKAEAHEEVDDDGDPIIRPEIEDSAQAADDHFVRARALTAEEATSGNYSLFDIVLPLPGFDIIYPANGMTDFYRRFMGSDRGGGLDPFDMRRNWKDISLSGSYRKILSRPGPDYTFEVRRYLSENEQFVETDYDLLRNKSEKCTDLVGEPVDVTQEAPDKLAVILKLQLGSSQYATMALRELMKTGGVKTYKPDFGGGR